MVTDFCGVEKTTVTAPYKPLKLVREEALVSVEPGGPINVMTFGSVAAVVEPNAFISRANACPEPHTMQPKVTPGYLLSMIVPLGASSKLIWPAEADSVCPLKMARAPRRQRVRIPLVGKRVMRAIV